MKGRVMRQSIWCAGLFCLSRSSNHTPETDQRDQMNQLPATRQEIVPVWVQGPSATPVSWFVQERRSCTWYRTDV